MSGPDRIWEVENEVCRYLTSLKPESEINNIRAEFVSVAALTSEEAVERVARALSEPNSFVRWDDRPAGEKAYYKQQARAAIAAVIGETDGKA